MIDSNLSALAYAYGKPPLTAKLRSTPEDFQVTEDLGFSPSGSGEHVFLYIEKINTNTEWLADKIAKIAKVKSFDVSFAGLKDRNAITRQWFSVYLPTQRDIDWQQLTSPLTTILEITRHNKKLRRGALIGNHFKINLSEVKGDRQAAENLLLQISKGGVPNYYGAQRFGHNGNNLVDVTALFENGLRVSRAKKSLLLSSARSWLFNLLLSERISLGTWSTPMVGDAMILAGTHSYFVCDNVDETILQRCRDLDIFPSGPLYGRGHAISQGKSDELETAILQQYPSWLCGLEKAGLLQERRPLILPIKNLQWTFQDDQLSISFFLQAGSYATSVLRELALNYP